ncbi:hypothetical protein LSTR_LSTR015439 [Laodelphax striatellus]|uniref:Solute carrier family 25 member 46 n=1 Tax=Laodelphax striatellus TaxID=195883 RepID=A0A482X683_LAOST|nr:hypothetical protein LSTR_LSTR015439 [Laodelphax striatellus]
MAGMEDYFGPRRKGDMYDVLGNDEEIRGAVPRRPSDLKGLQSQRPYLVNEMDYQGVKTAPRPYNINIDRDITIRPAKIQTPIDDDEAVGRKYITTGVGLVTLITENLLCHPFVVLRRQCQVHNNSSKYHLVSVTLLPVIWRLNQRQGLTTLWKGLGSMLLVRGMALAVEDIISKFTPWPKEFKWHHSAKSHGQHIMLKCLTLAIITTFYSASLVESVQSDIASEKPGIFDVFREGVCRLVSWGSPQKGRMLPILSLVVPTVVFGVMKYIFGLIVQNVTSRMLLISHKINQQRQGALSKDVLNPIVNDEIELQSNMISLIISETVFYPFETILHRLHLQGTRTIIDNLDTGSHVTPILTSYEGVVDCYETTLRQEGAGGLYKGFGSLVMQFAAHVAVVKTAKLVLMTIANSVCGGGSTGASRNGGGAAVATPIGGQRTLATPTSHLATPTGHMTTPLATPITEYQAADTRQQRYLEDDLPGYYNLEGDAFGYKLGDRGDAY